MADEHIMVRRCRAIKNETIRNMFSDPALFSTFIDVCLIFENRYSFENIILITYEAYNRGLKACNLDLRTQAAWGKNGRLIPEDTKPFNLITRDGVMALYDVSDIPEAEIPRTENNKDLQSYFNQLYKLFIMGAPQNESLSFDGLSPAFDYATYSIGPMTSVRTIKEENKRNLAFTLARGSGDEGLKDCIHGMISEAIKYLEREEKESLHVYVSFVFCRKLGINLPEVPCIYLPEGIDPNSYFNKCIDIIFLWVNKIEKGILVNRHGVQENLAQIEKEKEAEIEAALAAEDQEYYENFENEFGDTDISYSEKYMENEHEFFGKDQVLDDSPAVETTETEPEGAAIEDSTTEEALNDTESVQEPQETVKADDDDDENSNEWDSSAASFFDE